MSTLKKVPCLTVIILVLSITNATPPSDYVKNQENDKDSPRYEYGYDVRDGKGSRQGHLESRDGEHALGLYYVKLRGGSGTSVRYFADDWGYHPLVFYSSATKTSSAKAHFALGEKAVAALNEEPQLTIDSLPAAGPSATAVANSLDKIASSAGRAALATGSDILKVHRPSNSAHVVTQLAEGQADVSTANNLIDSNSNDKEEIGYRNMDGASPGSPSALQTYSRSKVEQLGASRNKFSEIDGLSAASYKIVDIGGAGNFYSESPPHPPLVLETVSVGSDSESSAFQFGEHYPNVNAEVLSAQEDGNFGERIQQKSLASSTSAVSSAFQGQQLVSEHNLQLGDFEKDQSVSISVPQALQSHSVRPIVVADIYSRENEHKESVIQSPNIVEGSNKTPGFISSTPESLSNVLSEGSTVAGASSTSPGASFTFSKSEGKPENVYDLPLVSVPTAHEGQEISVTSDEKPSVPLAEHSTQATLWFSPLNINNGYYPESQLPETNSKDEQNSAYAGNTVSGIITGHTSSEKPVLLSYIQAESVSSGGLYTSSNSSAEDLTYATSTPGSVSSHLELSGSSTAGGAGSSIFAHYSTPLSLFISQSHKASSKQESSGIVTSNNGQSGHIVPVTESSYSSSIKTTTPPPDENSFISLSHEERDSTIASSLVNATPPTVVFVSTPQTISASLTSSAQILAPLQAGVSLITSNNERPTEQKYHTASSTSNYQNLSPPQVKEELDDLPAPNTVVEVQKAIPLDFNILKEQALRLADDTEKLNWAHFPLSSDQVYQNAKILKPKTVESTPQKQIQQHESKGVKTENNFQYAHIEPLAENSTSSYANNGIQSSSIYPATVVQQVQNTEPVDNLEEIRTEQFNFGQTNPVPEAQNLLNQHEIDSENQKLIEALSEHSRRLEGEPARLNEKTAGLQSSFDVLSNLESQLGQQIVHESERGYAQSQDLDGLVGNKPQYLNAAQTTLLQSPVKQIVSTFNKRPEELESQLESEYSRQLIEEQRQEVIELVEPSKTHEEQQRPQADSSPLGIHVEPNIPVEQTHINVHVVENAVALPITNLAPVERPVSFPHPVAIPVPYAISHPVGVPVTHIHPYLQLLTLPINEPHPLYLQRKHHPELGSTSSIHYHMEPFSTRTPVPTILKALQHGGGRYGIPISQKQSGLAHHHHHHHPPHQQLQVQGQNVAESNRVSHVIQILPPPLPHKSPESGRPSQKARHQAFLKNLCIEYGFKPPLVPSIQIDDATALSFVPPPQKE